MKDLDPEQRLEAAISHREKQYQENMDFRAKIHNEQKVRLEQKLSQNDQLDKAQKQSVFDRFEDRYQETTLSRRQ